MSQATPETKYLKDYTPPDYWVDTVDLHFDLNEDLTKVRSTMTMRRNIEQNVEARPLVLEGRALTLESVILNGTSLNAEQYSVSDETLTVLDAPDAFTLEITTTTQPSQNTSLEGLYTSSGNFCTQCEPEGFRKITYFLDRPDVMARYSTTIVGDKTRYPVLLSNGNPVESGELENGKHWVKWEDPFKKPSYLFALVAGDLVHLEDTFITMSGREVTLRLYVEKMNIDKCEHAMQSLKNAMKWDEETFAREYDLDIYMIVAVNDFNMGAMENKGLNVFNSKYVLARPETATDRDFQMIEGVIGHEYFHNWTGNRITCRDWFQLSLKEGLTIFRDQEFSSTMGSRAVKRITDVRDLRASQFPEDAGPMAHSVRPDSYIEINNFYTVTVYNKGSEVVRMIYNFLGKEGFRKGMDLYFERYDGQAVTTDDFVQVMEEANGADFTQFRLWYSQAGTPVLDVKAVYEMETHAYTLTIRQSCAPTPGQPEKAPYYIPLAMGLIDQDGNEIPLQLVGEEEPAASTTRVLALSETEQSFSFVNVSQPPVPSLLRGFSAPVRLNFDYTDDELAFLMAHDTDDFNRWEAGQRLMVTTLLGLVKDYQQGRDMVLNPVFVEAFQTVLRSTTLDKALIAEAITLPSETDMGEWLAVIDVDAIHAAWTFVTKTLARDLKPQLMATYQENQSEASYSIDNKSIGQRRLKNLVMSYLMKLDDSDVIQLGLEQFQNANNMTDSISAFRAIVHKEIPERTEVIEAFYEKWKDDSLVLDKWFAMQATAPLPSILDHVKALMGHPAFSLKNPNKVRALIAAFSRGNPVRFHAANGSGYTFLGDQIVELNSINPQVASRMLSVMNRWKKYDEGRQALMKEQLQRILGLPDVSKDVYEIAMKNLG